MNRTLDFWKISALVLVAVAGLLAVRVRAQQNRQAPQPPTASGGHDFVLRNASGAKIAEWVVDDSGVHALEAPGSIGPIPPAPQLPVPPKGQAPVPRAEFTLRSDGSTLGVWSVPVGAILECYDAAGKLIWFLPMRAAEQSTGQ